MENKSHVWNHQPDMFAILQITTEITMLPHEITIFPSQITLSPRLKMVKITWRFMDTWRFGHPKRRLRPAGIATREVWWVAAVLTSGELEESFNFNIFHWTGLRENLQET
jgi:hypothetical protein